MLGAWRGLCLLVPTYLLITNLPTCLLTSKVRGAWHRLYLPPTHLLLTTSSLRRRRVVPGVGYTYHLPATCLTPKVRGAQRGLSLLLTYCLRIYDLLTPKVRGAWRGLCLLPAPHLLILTLTYLPTSY